MSYSLRNYRHRNPQGGEEKKGSQPFFQGDRAKAVQRKKKDAFFHVQRLATSHEDEKLGTNDARMEKDKEEPLKPAVQTKPMEEKKPEGKDGGPKAEEGKKEEKKKKPVQKAEDPKKDKKPKKGDDGKKKKKKGGAGAVQKKEKKAAGPSIEAELEQQAGKGSQLSAEVLTEMSQAFGMDFSHVRIHYNTAAAALCNRLHAQAFTHGCDIYFNEGQYRPETAEGKRLLAHELTHVVQQHS